MGPRPRYDLVGRGGLTRCRANDSEGQRFLVIIAIDGPAASGKGTLARRLARHYGLKHLDTGRIYRAVAALVLARGEDLDDIACTLNAAQGIDLDALAGMDLASDAIGEAASRVAVHPPLRSVLVERQRAFANDAATNGRGAVLDGRDVGTVVLPNASVKLFVTADVATRARRRALELYGEAQGPRYDALCEALTRRDTRDAERPVGALKPAQNALLLDTSGMDADAVFKNALGLVENAASA